MTGVVGFVDASNIPPGGLNSVTGVVEDAENEITEEIFSSGHLYYAGQSVGLVVADTYEHARYERCRGRRRHLNFVHRNDRDQNKSDIHSSHATSSCSLMVVS